MSGPTGITKSQYVVVLVIWGVRILWLSVYFASRGHNGSSAQ